VACREAVRRRSPEPPGFGWTTETDCRCDLVANVFVLSVLPDPGQRIKALQRAARFVRPGGHLFVVTRSPGDIEPRGASASWPVHHDGYWSSEAKGIFQQGVSTGEIVVLGRRAGLRPAAPQALLAGSSAAAQGLLTKLG